MAEIWAVCPSARYGDGWHNATLTCDCGAQTRDQYFDINAHPDDDDNANCVITCDACGKAYTVRTVMRFIVAPLGSGGA